MKTFIYLLDHETLKKDKKTAYDLGIVHIVNYLTLTLNFVSFMKL